MAARKTVTKTNCASCPEHLGLALEVGAMSTLQKVHGQQLESMAKDIKQVGVTLETIKLTALTNQATTDKAISEDRIKVRPLFWVIAVVGTAIISTATHFVRDGIVALFR